MITVPEQLLFRLAAGQYSEYLDYIFKQLKTMMLDAISDVLPLALTVAGAILVVTLGWRLFRNFTRG